LELQKAQLINMEVHHLPNKIVYTTGYHINLLEPYLVTKEQHKKVTKKITHKINKYLKEIHKELSQQVRADLTDILQQVNQKMTFRNVLYATKLDIHNSNADSQSVENVGKLNTLGKTVQTSHATNTTNMAIKHGNMIALAKNANDTDATEECAENSKKRKMNFNNLTIDTILEGLYLDKKIDWSEIGFW